MIRKTREIVLDSGTFGKIQISIYLYGMYFEPSAKALMQFPKANRLLLIFAPSRNLAAPREEVADPLSDPAKSIMDSLATLTSADKPDPLPVCLM